MTAQREKKKMIKCIIWDLDNTIWEGVLSESDALSLRPGVKECIVSLDRMGVLNAIASRNQADEALQKLRQFDLAQYFIAPQIGWGAKSISVTRIAKDINIGVDTLAFIDDDPFERSEVLNTHPDIAVFDAEQAADLWKHERIHREQVTPDASRRREMYQTDNERITAEKDYDGPPAEFLGSLKLDAKIFKPDQDDLVRAEELTARTNQLNATGYTYTAEELSALLLAPDHILMMVELSDRFGKYGQIGLALVHETSKTLNLRLVLFSCRVLSRGIPGIFLNWLGNMAAKAGKTLSVEYIPTPSNRPMLIALRLAGFELVSSDTIPYTLVLPKETTKDLASHVKVSADSETLSRFYSGTISQETGK